MPRKRKPIEYYVDENGCHVCTSHPTLRMKVNGKTEFIYNIIYRERFGEPDKGKHVYRVCGNKHCINPEHMKAMTLSEFETRPIEYVVDENGCHICTSHSQYKVVNGKTMQLHTYVYKTKVRNEIPKGMIVFRKCGNKKCINTEHMTLVPKSDPRPIEYEVDPVKGCHICTSHQPNSSGYPQIKVNGKPNGVHCFVYEREHGKIPKGYMVRHKCDNKLCINPAHLEIGTHDDNMRDMVERGRSARGSKHGRAKLTEEDVREIRRRLAAGEMGKDLAEEYGVTATVITAIKKRKLWKHVD